MYYIADLHAHSHYAQATSKDLNLKTLYQWAQVKGIQVLGTGDFTHPTWLAHLKEQLIPAGNGFYHLKNPPAPLFPGFTPVSDIHFCLTAEVSCIYQDKGRLRKNHHLLYAPDFATVEKLNQRLASGGSLTADGRPTLDLSAYQLLELVSGVAQDVYYIPAHVWTPWFSILGSKTGYESVYDCFRDLEPLIFALETGLSADPAIGWRLSSLDKYTFVSNSDAHSPQNLGREANRFDTDLSYHAMFQALKTRKGFLGTLEFFPEEGKYYLDGHRKCNVCLTPAESLHYQKRCPVCKRPLTLGVLHRVHELADRTVPEQPSDAPKFSYHVPLPEIIAAIMQQGVKTKGVAKTYQKAITLLGNEFYLVHHAPLDAIARQLGKVYAQAIDCLRKNLVTRIPGYDGLYGRVNFPAVMALEDEAKQLTINLENG